jgi:hypothetical protein
MGIQDFYSNLMSRLAGTTSPKLANDVLPFPQMSLATLSTPMSAFASSRKTRLHKRNPILTHPRVRSSVCSVSHNLLHACALQTSCSGMMSTRHSG